MPEDPRVVLERRLRQQCLMAQFGLFALRNESLAAILTRACEVAAQGLEVKLAKVLRWRETSGDFLIIAGIGWHPGVVGHATISGGTQSPAGFAFETGEPVISNHLDLEERFRTPAIMVEHGVRRAVNVLIDGENSRFGVLETDSESDGAFEPHDTHFLQSLANTLGAAIDKEDSRTRIELLNRDLRESLRLKDIMGREGDHRIKNSLSIVMGMLSMQARRAGNAETRAALDIAANRIATVAKVHASLYSTSQQDSVDLAVYIGDLAKLLGSSHETAELRVDAVGEDFEVTSESAVSFGIIVSELVINAIKHARLDRAQARIVVTMTRTPEMLTLDVADNGVGLPDGFDPKSGGGLGMRIIQSLAASLIGEFSFSSVGHGTRFGVSIPWSRVNVKRG